MQIWEISNDCKINLSAHQSCTIEQSFGWKKITRIPSRPTGILQHLEVFYIFFWSWKTRGNFFFRIFFLNLFFITIFFKNIDAEVWKWRALRPETIVFLFLSRNQINFISCLTIKTYECYYFDCFFIEFTCPVFNVPNFIQLYYNSP